MEPLPIPEYDLVPLDRIARGLTGIRILFVNVFAVEANESWVLIDAGLPFSASRIKAWAAEKFPYSPRPRSIVLTHGHFDHAGAVRDLADDWDVPVYAHQAEFPYLTGKEKYPPPDPTVGGGLMSIMSPLYPRGPYDISDRLRALPAGGVVPDLPEWKWIETPGHTAGHISLFRENDQALLVGDAFCTAKQQSFLAVAQQKPELNGPPAYYTPDWDSARDSVRKLAALRPAIIAPGHGLPMSGAQVDEALQTLARDFDRIAMPQKAA